MEQKAQEYINKLYIDYGDLNEKAEEQIKQAFIDGMKEQLLIQRVSQQRELLAFAKEMQNIGFNEMDDAEKVVDIYIKANCG
ncbi:MAG: hypothetical protein WC939_02885 [Acholeplasmataceae bacterium]